MAERFGVHIPRLDFEGDDVVYEASDWSLESLSYHIDRFFDGDDVTWGDHLHFDSFGLTQVDSLDALIAFDDRQSHLPDSISTVQTLVPRADALYLAIHLTDWHVEIDGDRSGLRWLSKVAAFMRVNLASVERLTLNPGSDLSDDSITFHFVRINDWEMDQAANRMFERTDNRDWGLDV